MQLTNEHYELGRIGYEGYCRQSGGVSLVSGDKLPEFATLNQSIKDAWAAAAIAIGREIGRPKPGVCTCIMKPSTSAYAMVARGYVIEPSNNCPIHATA